MEFFIKKNSRNWFELGVFGFEERHKMAELPGRWGSACDMHWGVGGGGREAWGGGRRWEGVPSIVPP